MCGHAGALGHLSTAQNGGLWPGQASGLVLGDRMKLRFYMGAMKPCHTARAKLGECRGVAGSVEYERNPSSGGARRLQDKVKFTGLTQNSQVDLEV